MQDFVDESAGLIAISVVRTSGPRPNDYLFGLIIRWAYGVEANEGPAECLTCGAALTPNKETAPAGWLILHPMRAIVRWQRLRRFAKPAPRGIAMTSCVTLSPETSAAGRFRSGRFTRMGAGVNPELHRIFMTAAHVMTAKGLQRGERPFATRIMLQVCMREEMPALADIEAVDRICDRVLEGMTSRLAQFVVAERRARRALMEGAS